jgi:hypothetical protein
MVQWLKIPYDLVMPSHKQDLIEWYYQTKLRTVEYATYKDADDAIMADVEVLNAILADVANCDIPVVNGDEAEHEVVNEN